MGAADVAANTQRVQWGQLLRLCLHLRTIKDIFLTLRIELFGSENRKKLHWRLLVHQANMFKAVWFLISLLQTARAASATGKQ